MKNPNRFDLLAKKDRPHGTRLRYMGGCHCMLCRAANSRYECQRLAARKSGDWNGYVLAEVSRLHVLALRRVGVGYKRVAICAGISKTTIAEILSGKKKKIRARTERKILSVPAAAVSQAALIPAAPFWKLINDLRRRFGYSKAKIASMLLGRRALALQLNREKMTLRSAQRVMRLHEELTKPRPKLVAVTPEVPYRSTLSEAYLQ